MRQVSSSYPGPPGPQEQILLGHTVISSSRHGMVAYSPPETALDWLLDLPGTLRLDRSALKWCLHDCRIWSSNPGQTWQKRIVITPDAIWDMGRKENKPGSNGGKRRNLTAAAGKETYVCRCLRWRWASLFLTFLVEILPGVTNNSKFPTDSRNWDLGNPGLCAAFGTSSRSMIADRSSL